MGVVPTRVEHALIATEDRRFYSHHGLDALAASGAPARVSRGGDQGGATLDQQLAKLIWTPAGSGLTDKVTAGDRVRSAASVGGDLLLAGEVIVPLRHFADGQVPGRDAARLRGDGPDRRS